MKIWVSSEASHAAIFTRWAHREFGLVTVQQKGLVGRAVSEPVDMMSPVASSNFQWYLLDLAGLKWVASAHGHIQSS